MCDLTCLVVFFFQQKTANAMRISDWSSDVCSSDLFTDDRIADALPALQGEPDNQGLIARIDDDTSCVVVQYPDVLSSEERRVGQECGSTFRYRRSPAH